MFNTCSAGEAGEDFLIDMGKGEGTTCVGRCICTGLNRSLAVRHLIYPYCRENRADILLHTKSHTHQHTAACHHSMAFLLELKTVAGKKLNPDLGALCQCVSIRGDNTVCAKEAGILCGSLAPSSKIHHRSSKGQP